MKLVGYSGHRRFGRITDLTVFFHRLISTVTQVFKDSRFVLHTGGKLKRLCLVYFRKGYVQRRLLVRKGSCRQCGACCNLLFTCPMLTKQGRCLVYGSCRPQACKVFPIDQRDIDEVKFCGGQCGYRFDNEYSENTSQEKEL